MVAVMKKERDASMGLNSFMVVYSAGASLISSSIVLTGMCQGKSETNITVSHESLS